MTTRRPVLLSSLAYALGAFGCGFAFGVVRTVWLAPSVGPLAAVAIEGPIMLGACWFVCGWALRRWPVPTTLPARLWMGLCWFGLLQLLEAVFALGLLGVTPDAYLAGMTTEAGLLGLVWMAIAALFPVMQRGR